MAPQRPPAPALRPRQAATLAWTLFSAVVGAGYASGQELVLFLGSCGRQSVPAALLVGTLIGLASLLPDPADAPPHSRAPGRPAASVLAAGLLQRVVALVLAWVTLAAMVAAMAHLMDDRGGPRASLLVAAAATWAGAALPLHRGLGPISRTLGPLMALAILAEAAVWLALPPVPPPPSGSDMLTAPMASTARCLEGLLIYAAGNALFARLAIERSIAAARLPCRRLVAACAAGGVVTGAVAAAGLFAIRAAGTSQEPMPLMAAAARLHPAATVLHRAVVASAAYTTAVAGAHALATPAAARVGGAGALPVWAALVVASVLPAAGSGFVETVHRLYPVGAWAALGALALPWVFARPGRRRLY